LSDNCQWFDTISPAVFQAVIADPGPGRRESIEFGHPPIGDGGSGGGRRPGEGIAGADVPSS
jgi:hypothetical protein